MKFVNLYVQTEYSMLSSALKINFLIDKALENNSENDDGLTCLGICDNNNMHGAIKFYLRCKEKKVKPIIGVKIDLVSDFNYINSVLLYAMNNDGYRNLLKITTLKNTIKKNLKIEDIYDYLNGIIVILPNEEHELVKAYLEGSFDNLNLILKKYLSINNKENTLLYLGLDIQSLASKYSLDDLIYFCKQKNIKTVALHKTSFYSIDDYEVYKILRSVDLNTKEYNGSEKERNSYFISNQKAIDLFRKYPDLIKETENIANMCNVEIEFGKYKMPVYDVIDSDSKTYLQDLAIIGLKKRLTDNNINKNEYKKYIDRLQYELNIINKMGFNDYFLIVYDFIKYAKGEKILVGPGRGSGPSSLVAYSLGITDINPLEFGLLFERFLNPERISMPDIDTDFPDDTRENVIRYMGRRYGTMRVAHICTFGTYGPRMAIRDIARIINLKALYLDEIIKNVPSDAESLNTVLKSNNALSRMVDENETIKYVIKMAIKLENLPRNLSVHAAGIIMADQDLVNYAPLSDGIDGLYQTQYEAGDLEKLGLVKIDFLGLRNLTIIDKILQKINNQGITNINNTNINKIPLNDKKVYEMLAHGETDGIFQLESAGMRKTLIQLQTNSFIDIVNALALYRPGPMEMIPLFVQRKLGKTETVYPHPDLEEILKPTYGTIVFQEQILQIASKFSGYSLGEADILRRAVSKKKVEELKNQQEKFINGAIKNGYKKEVAEKIYDLIFKFANYGFNKSHSVAYSFISYQMAYLKCHYFVEFMAVLMSYCLGRSSVLKSYILECNKRNIEVVLPSVNYSTNGFEVINHKIYYSLLAINGFGDVACRALMEERNKNGLYQSYDEFIARTKSVLNRKMVESLIYAGAMDEFKLTRKTMILEYDKSIELSNYGEMFKDQLVERDFDDEEFGFEDISNFERLVLGFNFKYDIFKQYGYIKKKYKTVNINQLQVGQTVNIMFLLDTLKVIKTKKGDQMAFGSLVDDTGMIDGTFFPKIFNEYKDNLVLGKMYIGEAKIEKREERIQAIINKLFVKKTSQ